MMRFPVTIMTSGSSQLCLNAKFKNRNQLFSEFFGGGLEGFLVGIKQ